jgi:ribonuclease BN (tRNA processing enzyme)
VGFEVTVGGRRLVVSGDTGPCAALDRAVRGADLALIEATFSRAVSRRPDSHLSVAQARRIGRRARDYRLYHLSPDARRKLRPGEEATRIVLEP